MADEKQVSETTENETQVNNVYKPISDMNELELLREIAKSIGNIESMVHLFYSLAVAILVIFGIGFLIVLIGFCIR
ncbi:hypothetical protein DW974_12635 [Lachnospiraceae bacterium AM48-27BH]|nr:hypothetical protein DW974_12635 [Lachnospiraceae bacterium AM48-27BH]